MVIKRIKFPCWKKLKDEAERYAALGYKVECKGYDDISSNILTIMSDEEDPDE
jgi:hypothetical protein